MASQSGLPMTSGARTGFCAPRVPEFAATNKWEDCKKFCSRPDVVLDCGANVGQSAVNLRQAYPQAVIHCFEPVSSVFEQLERKAPSLRLRVHRLAVTGANGRATMFLTASPESNSLLPFLEEGNPLAASHQVVGTESVCTVRLDDWCRSEDVDTRRVGLLKMDVQGGELDALKGAPTILKTVSVVLLEVAFVPFYRDCPLNDDVEAFMAAKGFKRRAMYRSPKPEIWADALYVPAGSSS